MGFFSRLGALIRGFFGLFVGGIEERNPDLLFEDIRNRIDRARREAEQQIVEIQTNAELIKIEVKSADKNLAAVRMRIGAAQKQGDKDVLVELLMQEEELQATYENNKATFDNAMTEVAKIREDYKIFESEMNNKLNEIKTLKSQAKMASLRENINSMNARYTTRSSSIGKVNDGLVKARDVVNRKTARANAMESLGSENMELKMQRLDAGSARERARARAEAMLTGEQGFEVKEKIENKA
ncbi:MAG: PspA/IM30 family protein [Clostridiales bacterium]|nr:PspA/IM30 family protein [Clostridiales bacterium]